MRTLIQGSWVVGHADGQHQVIRDGVCVVEDDRVVHVGKSYHGPVDATIDARGKLVTPGLISTHEHAAGVGSDYPYLDVGRPESQGRNYLNWMAGLPGKPRYRVDQAVAATFALGQSLCHGTTTVVEIGGGGNPPRLVGIVEELGIRV
jgi:5-methylthioadenosine/S-adenosylhomocysteine deaminase